MNTLWPETTQPIVLSPNEAHVFAVPLDQVGISDKELLKALSADERQRAERYQLEKPRRQFVAGRAALRMLLAEHLGMRAAAIPLPCEAHGKPRLGDASRSAALRFNLAHSQDVVLVAVVSGCEVGVDVEQLRTVSHLEQIAQRYLHTSEFDAIVSLPPGLRDEAFLRYWTGKEAIVKAVGTGLSHALSSFRVPVEHHNGTWIDVPGINSSSIARVWLLPLTPCRGYLAAIACIGEQRRVRCFTLRL